MFFSSSRQLMPSSSCLIPTNSIPNGAKIGKENKKDGSSVATQSPGFKRFCNKRIIPCVDPEVIKTSWFLLGSAISSINFLRMYCFKGS